MTKCFFCCLSCEVHDYGVWEKWATDSYATQGKASCIPLIKANRQQLPGISQETVNNHIASNNNISNTLLGYWHATCGFRTPFSCCQDRFWTHLRSLSATQLGKMPLWQWWLKATVLMLKGKFTVVSACRSIDQSIKPRVKRYHLDDMYVWAVKFIYTHFWCIMSTLKSVTYALYGITL